MTREGGPSGTASAATAAKQVTTHQATRAVDDGWMDCGIAQPDALSEVGECSDPACPSCVHARDHAWWGPRFPPRHTHCRACCATFKINHHHCTVCCTTFRTDAAARRHDPHGVCLDPSSVTDRVGNPVLRALDAKYGVVWARIGRGVPPSRLRSRDSYAQGDGPKELAA